MKKRLKQLMRTLTHDMGCQAETAIHVHGTINGVKALAGAKLCARTQVAS